MAYEKGELITSFSKLTFGSIIYNEKGEYAVFTHEGLIQPIKYALPAPKGNPRHIMPAHKRYFNSTQNWYATGKNLGDLLVLLSKQHELHTL